MEAYERVLVGLDLSESNAELILERACHLADPDAIEVLHVSEHLHSHYEEYPPNQGFPNSEILDEAIKKETDAHLERFCRPFGIKKHRVLGGPWSTFLRTTLVKQPTPAGRHSRRTRNGSASPKSRSVMAKFWKKWSASTSMRRTTRR